LRSHRLQGEMLFAIKEIVIRIGTLISQQACFKLQGHFFGLLGLAACQIHHTTA
jgi:hypothetical protein